MINIVIPMAGEGSRFKAAGYQVPKPFIKIDGVSMVRKVMDNVSPLEPHRFILIHRKEHLLEMGEFRGLENVHLVQLDEKTEGAACTVLMAEKYINSNDPLIIANSDQLVKWNNGTKEVKVHFGYTSNLTFRACNSIQDMINAARLNLCDGMIATFKDTNPKWSFVRTEMDHFGIPLVKEVAEKDPISNQATCGIYYYTAGRYFVEAAKAMIRDNERVRGEFYVCPVYNKMMKMFPFMNRISIYEVERMIGLGTPEDLEAYLYESETFK